MTYEPKIWGRLLQNLCPSAERWLEAKRTCFVQWAYKNRPKRKETSILSSEQEMKSRFVVMSQEQISNHPVEESSSCHPRELRQMKSDFMSMLSVFLNSEAVLQKEFFLHCQPVNQHFFIGVLRVFMEDVEGKCLTSGLGLASASWQCPIIPGFTAFSGA